MDSREQLTPLRATLGMHLSGPRLRVEPRGLSAVPARANASRQAFGAPIGSER